MTKTDSKSRLCLGVRWISYCKSLRFVGLVILSNFYSAKPSVIFYANMTKFIIRLYNICGVGLYVNLARSAEK